MMYNHNVYIKTVWNMIRTQIYLTEKQHHELVLLSKKNGRKQSELIREAVDKLIKQNSLSRRDEILRKAAGLWEKRDDIPDFKTTRSNWDRN